MRRGVRGERSCQGREGGRGVERESWEEIGERRKAWEGGMGAMWLGWMGVGEEMGGKRGGERSGGGGGKRGR